jgi:iron(III) transport system permease protein
MHINKSIHFFLPSLGVVFALFLAAPILLVCFSWFMGANSSYFSDFAEKGLLQDYATNSALIGIGTVAATSFLAVPAAWWVSMYHFPARRLLEWVIILPLAIPSYIAAMTYADLLESSGVVQYWIRDTFHLSFGDYWFPVIRSTEGMVFILTVTLYPYIYLLARGAFLMQSRQMLETATILGYTRKRLFTRLSLPMARPALIAGAALVLMEALADFGVASLYGVPVLTTGIYRAWQSMYDPISAARMASLLLIAVIAALWLEKRSRGEAQYQNTTALYHPLERWRTSRKHAVGMMLWCAALPFFGFLLPMVSLFIWSLPNFSQMIESRTIEVTLTTFIIASVTASITVMLALLCAYGVRKDTAPRPLKWAIALLTCGYAIPASVIAVGILVTFLAMQQHLFFGNALLTGTVLGVVWGCMLRFLTIGFHTLRSGLERITPAMDEVATMLGVTGKRKLLRVHVPLLRGALLIAFLLIFIDTVKELPATLMLRPFNVTTLSIRIYELAKDGMLPHAAPLSLLLVSLSLVPVLLLSRRLTYSRPSGG